MELWGLPLCVVVGIICVVMGVMTAGVVCCGPVEGVVVEATEAVPEPTITGGPVVKTIMMIGFLGVVLWLGDDEVNGLAGEALLVEGARIGVVVCWLVLAVDVGQFTWQRFVTAQNVSFGGH